MTERLSKEREAGVHAQHTGYLNQECSAGQRKDSTTILELLAELDTTRTRLEDAQWVINNINKRVFPGETDSADALVQIVKERDALRVENEALLKWSMGVYMKSEYEITLRELDRAERELDAVRAELDALKAVATNVAWVLKTIHTNPSGDSYEGDNRETNWTRWARARAADGIAELRKAIGGGE